MVGRPPGEIRETGVAGGVPQVPGAGAQGLAGRHGAASLGSLQVVLSVTLFLSPAAACLGILGRDIFFYWVAWRRGLGGLSSPPPPLSGGRDGYF